MSESAGTVPHKIWTVTEVNGLLRDILENSFTAIWLSGEIGNLTLHRSGHVYLTLKDANTQIRAVFFGGTAQFRQWNLKEGDRLEAYGRLSVYEARGEYQFNIRMIRPCGIGELQQKFEDLKRKLAIKGYFDAERKRPVPALPGKIGVITSPSGAALHDFLKIALTRYPDLHIQICPAPVQGKGAENKLAQAVRFFNRIRSVDVIVLMRGGGSLEDLWPFNEEILADAVFNSQIPVVSAVGHEIDFTITDFVADLRVPTPSGAAELLVPEKQVLQKNLQSLTQRLDSVLCRTVLQAQHRIDRICASPVFRDSSLLVMEKMQWIDSLMQDAENHLNHAAVVAEHRLQQMNAAIAAYNPEAVLKRGYAILRNTAGKTIEGISTIQTGESLNIQLADGLIEVTVDRIHKKRH